MKLGGIIGTIVIIAILFILWKKGVFGNLFGGSGTGPVHYTPIPGGGKNVKIDVAGSAADLYTAMERPFLSEVSTVLFGTGDDKTKTWGRFNALPNDAFIAVYNGFNKMYEQKLGRTLTEEIAAQHLIGDGGITSIFSNSGSSLRDSLVKRLRSLSCP